MGDLLDRFGLIEFFAYLCPGVITLLSLLLWARPDPASIVGKELASQGLVLGGLLLIIAYAFGLIVAWLGNAGSNRFLRASSELKAYRQGNRGHWRRRLRLHLEVPLMRPFFWVPKPRQNSATLRGSAAIGDGLHRYAGLQGLSDSENPWDRLAIYRTVVFGRVGPRGQQMLTEADSAHKRVLFCFGIAMTAIIWAVGALARLVITLLDEPRWGWLISWSQGLPVISPIQLVVIVVLGVAVSVGLRMVAGRWWENELLLSISLTKLH